MAIKKNGVLVHVTTQTESRLAVAGNREMEGWGVTVDRDLVPFWGDRDVLEADSGDSCTAL